MTTLKELPSIRKLPGNNGWGGQYNEVPSTEVVPIAINVAHLVSVEYETERTSKVHLVSVNRHRNDGSSYIHSHLIDMPFNQLVGYLGQP